jgi:GTP-binding protein EngB required for normal cell division
VTLADRGPDLAARLEALDEVVGLADGRLDEELVSRARAVLGKAHERLARGPQAVVVALAGGTGSGKSSLFNALIGQELSRVGAVRPVTGEVVSAAIGEPEQANAVLDWLHVRRRHQVDAAAGLPEGLVLLDLPDNDSVSLEHRETVDRFVERVDAMVWVLDPLKYAQRALHEGYLRLLAAHARVLIVVLNHADTLGAEARNEVLHDLRRLLAGEGLGKSRVLVTSARTGEGVGDLRTAIGEFVTHRRAVAERIAGDLGNVSTALAAQVGPPTQVALDPAELVRAVASAAGVQPLADAGRQSYVEDANDGGRPLLSAAAGKRLRRIRRPWRRLSRPAVTSGSTPRELSPVGVRHAVTTLADRAAEGLPHPWPGRLHTAGQSAAEDLPAAVAKALDRVDVHEVKARRWWRLFAVLGTVVELALLTGLLWLALLGVLAWFRVPEPPTPQWRDWPLPTLLALGGGLVWLLTGVVRRRLIAVGAGRHRTRMVAALETAVAAAAEEQALVPLRREVEAHARLAQALRRAAGRPG